MLKKFQKPTSLFFRYIKEAPGDEDKVSVTVAPRANRGADYGDDTNRVSVGPRANRGSNYGDDGEDATPPEDTTTDAPANDAETGTDDTDDAPTDYSDDGDDGADAGTDDTGETDDAGEGDAAGDEGGDEGGDDDDAPTDYNDDGEGGGDDTSTDDDTSDDENNGEDSEDEEEQRKKFHQYKRFLHLYNVLDSFIERCKNTVRNDSTQNAVIKTVTNNFSDLHENMFDFMTIKYKRASYVQVMVYFETALSIIRLNFEMLRHNKII